MKIVLNDIELKIAPIWKRLFAALIDSLILVGLLISMKKIFKKIA